MAKIIKYILLFTTFYFLFHFNVVYAYNEEYHCNIKYSTSWLAYGLGGSSENSYCPNTGSCYGNSCSSFSYSKNNLVDYVFFDDYLFTINGYYENKYIIFFNKTLNEYAIILTETEDSVFSGLPAGSSPNYSFVNNNYKQIRLSLQNNYSNDSQIYFTANLDKKIYSFYNYPLKDDNRSFDNWDLVSTNFEKVYFDNFEKELYEESEESHDSSYNSLDLIYVPNYVNGQCVEIIDKDTIRVFNNESDLNYTDYYINSHYLSKNGVVDSSYFKQCSSLNFTDVRYFGNDFPQILFILLVLCCFSVIFPFILLKKFRKR